jgi:hypothetical protein
VVSDGSFKDSSGAATFYIELPGTSSYIQGCHMVQGPTNAQSAYRNELYSAILGIQCLATLVQKQYNLLMKGSIEVTLYRLSTPQQSFFHGSAIPMRELTLTIFK